MDTTPDIHHDLARVGVLKKGLLRGQPSNRSLASTVGTSPTTIGEWLRGRALPRELGLLLEMLTLVRAEATHRNLLDTPAEVGAGETVGALLDPDRWRASWETEHGERVRVGQEAADRERSRRALENAARSWPAAPKASPCARSPAGSG
ncbi:hypothetical protein [Nocardiopsis sp. CC223A]|uniref:hypothetical protein n=1 Tax=Nocardiopsis sp. CC223A TaxID=3044051 RepID=UPI00278C6FAC|nr:hypothetical protein [Nocardiopsis sp. CC223A]